MKNFKFLAALCCMLAVFTACEKDNINGNSGNDNATGNNNHEYVDLGLPSGTKWATCNVGASSPEKYGDYFAWGETEPKSTYDWNTYKWATATYDAEYDDWDLETFTKYNTISDCGIVDDKIVLDPEDDVATVNWGSKWRMPTQGEWSDLINNCTWTWTTYNGVYGYRITSNFNGNFIFLPATGGFGDDAMYHEEANCGYYWSSSLYTGYPHCAYCMIFTEDDISEYAHNCRFFGQSVRPVLK